MLKVSNYDFNQLLNYLRKCSNEVIHDVFEDQRLY